MTTKKCPKCGRKLIMMNDYNPTTKQNEGFIFKHIYDLSEIMSAKKLCYYLEKVK